MSDEYSNNAMADLMMEDAEAAFLRSTIMNNQATSKILIEKENKKHPDNSKKLIGKLLEKQGVKDGKLIDKILNETISTSSNSIEETETYTPTVQVSPEDTDMTISYRSMIPSINENAVKKVVNKGAQTMVNNLKTIGDVAKLVPGKTAEGIVAGAKVQAAIYNKMAKATDEEFNIDTTIKIQENTITRKKVVKEDTNTISVVSLNKLLSKVHEKLNENYNEELEEMADIISDAIAEALINDKDKVSSKYSRLFEEFKKW